MLVLYLIYCTCALRFPLVEYKSLCVCSISVLSGSYLVLSIKVLSAASYCKLPGVQVHNVCLLVPLCVL